MEVIGRYTLREWRSPIRPSMSIHVHSGWLVRELLSLPIISWHSYYAIIPLSRTEALRRWHSMNGQKATYRELLGILVEGNEPDSANMLIQLLGAKGEVLCCLLACMLLHVYMQILATATPQIKKFAGMISIAG